ncbi:hypothetical protein [Streptomyces sp. NPDC059708]|uniref:hypothetical protein n=1 Tax=Streptomyces sp. NPDC059708 TaxID=3346916 RepID=UPI0036A68332
MTDWPASKRNRRGRPSMTAEQQELADELQMRAHALRIASDGELSVAEAVHLAAVQLGLEAPHSEPEETPD